jgi:hypothetical protein
MRPPSDDELDMAARHLRSRLERLMSSISPDDPAYTPRDDWDQRRLNYSAGRHGREAVTSEAAGKPSLRFPADYSEWDELCW